MCTIKRLRSVFIWFAMFGQYHLLIVHNTKARSTRVIFVFLKIVFLMLILTSMIKPFRETSEDKSSFLYIVNGVAFNILILNLVEIVESLLQSKIFALMVTDIEKSLEHLNTFVNMKVHISAFAYNFRKKLFCCTIIFMSESFLRLFNGPDILNVHSNILLTISVLYKHMAVLHTMFYIDLQTLMLSSLNNKLNPVSVDSVNECLIIPTPSSSEALENLGRIKCVYSSVRNISENINKRFGCFLLSTSVNASINFVRSGTALVMAFATANNKLLLLRELDVNLSTSCINVHYASLLSSFECGQ